MRHLSNIVARATVTLLLLIGIGIAFNVTAEAQRRVGRLNDRQVGELLRRLEEDTARFRAKVDNALDRSRRDGTRAEDDINAFIRDFESATAQLRQRFDSRQSVAGDVDVLLQRAAVIDNFMGRGRGVARARNEWAVVKSDLNALASAYRSWAPGMGGVVGNGRNWDRYGNYGGSFQLRQTALNAGYNEGLKVGQNDRNNNRTSDYRNSSEYQRATTDYSSRLGNRELYRRYYQEGFQTGYNDGFGTQAYPQGGGVGFPDTNRDRRGRDWDRYGTYGGSSDLRQTALNAGYNEGIKVGRNDRNGNRASNYRDSSLYEKADKDYSSRLGDRELYRRYFREGFENGYNDGYNGN